MKSKWSHLKSDAIRQRKQGSSIRDIESTLGIPRSTLSGWFKNVMLTDAQKEKLDARHRLALIHAREKAILWHNAEKSKRIEHAAQEAEKSLKKIDEKDHSYLELALAMLYLGEGSKKNGETSLGNSNPMILKFFLSALTSLYGLERSDFGFALHLRADQNPEEMKRYWAAELGVPIDNFIKPAMDKRTIGSPSYSDYKGVCIINVGNVAIQRKLVYLSKAFCEKAIMRA